MTDSKKPNGLYSEKTTPFGLNKMHSFDDCVKNMREDATLTHYKTQIGQPGGYDTVNDTD